jgi:putative hydrolase of the HAD superfamily
MPALPSRHAPPLADRPHLPEFVRGATGQLLFMDGDDTLWDDNVHFEHVIEEFIAALDHSTLSAVEVREALDRIERATIATHGYGIPGFVMSLRACFDELAERAPTDEDVCRIERFERTLRDRPIEPIDGVSDTLEYLADRQRLVLVTKGHEEDQRLKVARSGLERFFADIVVVPEKTPAVYADITQRFTGEAGRTWMVGNSPRSDVNPALRAGLNAVYVPHSDTWHLESEEVAEGPGQVLVLEGFRQLALYF